MAICNLRARHHLVRPHHLAIIMIAVFATVLGDAPAAAQNTNKPKVAFQVGANTDYVFRGISQTKGDPSVFGGVDVTYGPGYAAVWVSNVDFDNGTDAEYALFAGVRPKVGRVTIDVGLIYYGYIDQPSGSDQNYWEGKIAASMPAGPSIVGVALYYSPEYFGDSGKAWYYEANAAVAVPKTKLSLSGAIGHQTRQRAPGYTTWNAGAAYALSKNLSVDVRYWDTAKDRYGDVSSGRVVAGVKVAF